MYGSPETGTFVAQLTTAKEATASRVQVEANEERKGSGARSDQTWETMVGTFSFLVNSGAIEELKRREMA